MKPQLVRITQSSNFTADGKLNTVYVVQFSVGNHGPFTVQVPRETFNAATVEAAMHAVADEINKLTPATV